MQTGRIVSHLMFGCAYFVCASATIGLTRYGGGVAFVWVASALLLARLRAVPAEARFFDWVAATLASILATGLFGFGWRAAAPLAILNAAEVWIALMVLRRTGGNDPVDILDQLKRFFLAAVLGSAVTGILAGGLLLLIARNAPGPTAVNWFIGHCTGMLTFAPIFTQAFSRKVAHWWREQIVPDPKAALSMLGLMVGLTCAAFLQNRYPLLFLPLLALVLVTYRYGPLGSAVALIPLLVVGTAATLAGSGPIQLASLDMANSIQFLQIYLAGTVLTVLPVASALSRRDEMFRQLRDSERRYRLLAEESSDVIATLEVDGLIRFISPSIERHCGYRPDELVGKYPIEIIEPAFHRAVQEAHAQTLRAQGRAVRVEYLVRLKSGEVRWFETNGRAVFDADGVAREVLVFVRDIQDRKATEARLAWEASTDALTGAFNRRSLLIAVDDAISKDMHGALAVFDLDHFKAINDGFGHAAGDQTLRAFAKLGMSMTRADDLFARIGGEEFAMFLPGATASQARDVCQRLLDAFAEQRIACGADLLHVTASAGITKLQANSADTLKRADVALYLAKRDGRDCLKVAA